MIKRFSFLLLIGFMAFIKSGYASSLQEVITSGTLPHNTSHTLLQAIELKPASLENSHQTAAICFLGGNCQDNAGYGKMGDESYTVDPSKQCQNEGYVKIYCNNAQEPISECPYDTSYGSGCKCKPSLVACSSDQTGVGSACGGKYVSCACKPEYLYTTANCTSPRSVSGATCGGKYNTCSCPKGVSAGTYGCKEYHASPCGSICKTANTDNCHNRASVTAPYGCMNYFADCSSKCEKAYTDNCRSRTEVATPYGCKTYWSDCSTKCQTAYTDNCHNRTAATANFGCQAYYADCTSKCQTAYTDNCHNRTSVTIPYGCKTYWSDCSTKCQTAYADNCHNRTDVVSSCPSNAVCTYFSDCSTKISDWKCKVGYEKSGNTCVVAKCKIGYIYYSDNLCTSPETHDSTKTTLGVVVYITDGGAHGQIIASRNSIESSTWGGYNRDIYDLTNHTDISTAQNDYDSCGNTDKILAAGNDYAAAKSARAYAPTPETKGKWCLPALGVLYKIRANLTAVKAGLAKAPGLNIASNARAWSSTEHDRYMAMMVSYDPSYTWGLSAKSESRMIFPVLEF